MSNKRTTLDELTREFQMSPRDWKVSTIISDELYTFKGHATVGYPDPGSGYYGSGIAYTYEMFAVVNPRTHEVYDYSAVVKEECWY